ncbi:receptor-like protein 37 [Pyrus x bretschneideri]|uniref:receptor-like protein 37 n=1 Tax=Pyrus x bretschneideri TaxID=225117 RepID=UPI00202EDFBF|nr:receptor-like protein 37 [Pyrus x bretschneideri]
MAKHLTIINLSYNQLTGQINSSHWENLANMVKLDLRHNLLDGTIPPSVFSLPLLQKLQLSNNHFSGQLPEFGNICTLYNLELSSNSLEGPIPMSIFNLQELRILSLSSNNFTGSFLLNDILQLKNLSSLDLSCNSLSINYNHTNSSHSSFPKITTLKLASGNLRRIPKQVNGSIPESRCNKPYLQVLDLSNNSLSGPIPQCLTAMSWTLAVLNLRGNKISGTLPDNFPQPCSLQTLDLNGNVIGSQFPKSLANCTMLEVLNLGNNQITDVFPCLLKSISSLHVLVLHCNKLYDRIECLKTNSAWTKLQIINIARNNLLAKYQEVFRKHGKQ